MNPFTGTAMFLSIWWVVLFAVLPIGTHPVEGADSASGWRGVPERPQLWRKAALTTAISVVLWLIAYAIARSGWIDFRHGWMAMH